MNYSGQRTLIVGAARQGTALARYLIKHGSSVVVTDLRPESDLQEAVRSLEDLPVKWALGGHPLELLDDTDVVYVSGGVPLDIPLVKEAMSRGIHLSNDSQIFLENAPCPVIGITGSAGKTTVTSLVGRMAEAETQQGEVYRKAWVGGNLGNPLISDLDEMQAEDIAVMELSSFQLEVMTISPHIAVILNITPNHLDRHGNMDAYIAAKSRILMFQDAEDVAVLCSDDEIHWSLEEIAIGHLISYGIKNDKCPAYCVHVEHDQVFVQEGTSKTNIVDKSEIELRGEHNLLNVLASCAASFAAGFSFEAMRAGIRGFQGVPHRLEFVRNYAGADWYNDSIATSPERVLAAVRSFEEPLVLLAGGRDKDLPWNSFADEVAPSVRELVLFGESAEMIRQIVSESINPGNLYLCETLEAAVKKAAEVAQEGDVVLLSPGGTSFDEFKDFADRGEWYRKWVQQLK